MHRLTYAVAVIDVIILFSLCSKYWNFFFNHSDFDTTLFTKQFYQEATEDEKHLVERHLLYLILPLLIMLIAKTYFGVRWIRLKFTRNALSTFYVVSMAFYFALVVQQIMILTTGWEVFSTIYKVECIAMMNGCIINWVFLHMHMNYVDRMHFR